jgi:hypothetical protein
MQRASCPGPVAPGCRHHNTDAPAIGASVQNSVQRVASGVALVDARAECAFDLLDVRRELRLPVLERGLGDAGGGSNRRVFNLAQLRRAAENWAQTSR